MYALQFNTGTTLELRDTTGQKGQHFLAARPASEPIVTRFGFNVADKLIGGQLPKSAKVVKDGKTMATIVLSAGTTESGNAKVSGTTPIEYNGEQHTLSVRISTPRVGTANVLIRSSRPRSGQVHESL